MALVLKKILEKEDGKLPPKVYSKVKLKHAEVATKLESFLKSDRRIGKLKRECEQLAVGRAPTGIHVPEFKWDGKEHLFETVSSDSEWKCPIPAGTTYKEARSILHFFYLRMQR